MPSPTVRAALYVRNCKRNQGSSNKTIATARKWAAKRGIKIARVYIEEVQRHG